MVLPLLDKSLPTVMAAIDQTLRAFGGVPTYALTDKDEDGDGGACRGDRRDGRSPHQEQDLPRGPLPTTYPTTGKKKAIVAVEHSILNAVWHMLSEEPLKLNRSAGCVVVVRRGRC